jgi:hypothetical protein
MALFSNAFYGSDYIKLGDVNIMNLNEFSHFYLRHYPLFSAINDGIREQGSQDNISRSLIWHGNSRVSKKEGV